jgi:hypothetical protein
MVDELRSVRAASEENSVPSPDGAFRDDTIPPFLDQSIKPVLLSKHVMAFGARPFALVVNPESSFVRFISASWGRAASMFLFDECAAKCLK